MSSPGSERSLYKSDGTISRKYITRKYYTFLLNEHKQALNLARLSFIPPTQNGDFDDLFEGDLREEYSIHKTRILPVIQALETHRISSLPKGKYKAEIARINSVVTNINMCAVEVAGILGSLNGDATVEVEIDTVQDSHIVQDGKKVVLSNKDIETIVKMIEQMNQRFRLIVRGSKKNDLFAIRGRNIGGGISNNFGTKKTTYFFSEAFGKYFDQMKSAIQIITENPEECLERDTLGFVKNDPEEGDYAVYPLEESVSPSEAFGLSETFYQGHFRGSTFSAALSIMNYNFRISEWYNLLERLSYPLHIRQEKGGEVTEDTIQEKDDQMAFTERLKDTDLIRYSISRNVLHLSLEKLEELLTLTGSSSLLGKSRNMDIISFFGQPQTAVYAYQKQEDGKTILVETHEMSVFEALSEKDKFNPDKITNANFDQFLNVLAKVQEPSGQILKDVDNDAVLIAEHQKRSIELRKNMGKVFQVDYIKKIIKNQIDRLRQVGALAGESG